MAINVDLIFENGYADVDILKNILNELSDDIENMKQKNLPNIKYNEKINLATQSDVMVTEDDFGKQFIDVEFSIINKSSVYILADKSALGEGSEMISHSFIDNIVGNRIIFSPTMNITKYNNIYITYNY